LLEETPDASLEEVQRVTAALFALPIAPGLARPVLLSCPGLDLEEVTEDETESAISERNKLFHPQK
jgi:hypothetical protein